MVGGGRAHPGQHQGMGPGTYLDPPSLSTADRSISGLPINYLADFVLNDIERSAPTDHRYEHMTVKANVPPNFDRTIRLSHVLTSKEIEPATGDKHDHFLLFDFMATICGIDRSDYRQVREYPGTNPPSQHLDIWRRLSRGLMVPFDWLVFGKTEEGFPQVPDFTREQEGDKWESDLHDLWREAISSRKDDAFTKALDAWVKQQTNDGLRLLLRGFHRSMVSSESLPNVNDAQLAAIAQAWGIPGAPDPRELIASQLSRSSTRRSSLDLGLPIQLPLLTIDGLPRTRQLFPDLSMSADLSLDRPCRFFNDATSGLQFSSIKYTWMTKAQESEFEPTKQQWYRACSSIDKLYRSKSKGGSTEVAGYLVAFSSAYSSVYSDDVPLSIADCIRCRRLFRKLELYGREAEHHLQAAIIHANTEWRHGICYHLPSRIREMKAILDGGDFHVHHTALQNRIGRQTIEELGWTLPPYSHMRPYIRLNNAGEWYVLHPDHPETYNSNRRKRQLYLPLRLPGDNGTVR